jgi:hypothetical protein
MMRSKASQTEVDDKIQHPEMHSGEGAERNSDAVGIEKRQVTAPAGN